jgi:D-3-phosphoglycerate dehydrogenase
MQVRDYLKGGVIQHAVNFFSLSGDVYDQVKPAIDLGERLGGSWARSAPARSSASRSGSTATSATSTSSRSWPRRWPGPCGPSVPAITLVNARALAQERGIDVLESTSSARLAFANLMAVRLKTSECDLSVAGTLFGRSLPRLVDVDGVEVDAIPQGRLLMVRNDDTPGVVGHIGTLLGERAINIARMTVGRKPGSGRAVMLIEVDNDVPPEVLAEVKRIPGVREARSINLG